MKFQRTRFHTLQIQWERCYTMAVRLWSASKKCVMAVAVWASVMKRKCATTIVWTNVDMDVDAIICVTMICVMQILTVWTRCLPIWVSAGDAALTQDAMCADK